MSAKFKYFLIVLLLSSVTAWAQTHKAAKASASVDWKDVDSAMGRAGTRPTRWHTQVLAAAEGFERHIKWGADQGWPGTGILGGIQARGKWQFNGNGRYCPY